MVRKLNRYILDISDMDLLICAAYLASSAGVTVYPQASHTEGWEQHRRWRSLTISVSAQRVIGNLSSDLEPLWIRFI